MNLECCKRLFGRVHNLQLINYLSKASSSYNLSNELTSEGNPLKKVKLTEFVEQKHHSPLKKIDDVLRVSQSNISQERKKMFFCSCGKLLPNRSLEQRKRLCEDVFNKIKYCGELTVTDCNAYIQICTENERDVDPLELLEKVGLKANEETYKLLLENACEMGNVERANEILAEMKNRNCTIDERVFNALTLGNTIKSGRQGGDTVLATMRAVQILATSATYWSMLRGLASRGNKEQFLHLFSEVNLHFHEVYFMQLLLKLGLNDGQDCVSVLKRKFKLEVIPRNLTQVFDHLCINLIHSAKAKAAIEMYCSLSEPHADTRFLLEEIVKSDINTNDIIEIADYLKAIGKNSHVFEDLYDISLRFGKPSLSWALMEKLERLRPHYFWPLIVKAAEQRGEVGVLDMLIKLRSMNAEIDSDTLEVYALPRCDLSNPKELLKRMQMLKLPLKLVLTPLLILLLNQNKIVEAHRLCNEFTVPVQGARMIKPLVNTWISTKDTKKCIQLLKRMSETNESSLDITGSVLLNITKSINLAKDCKRFDDLLKDINSEKLVITPTMSERIKKMLHAKASFSKLTEIVDKLDNLVDMSVKGDKVLHPRNMSLHELECHLIELRSKNKETRGVLRRLVQLYARDGNVAKLNECVQAVGDSGYKLSPGMKSSLLQGYVRSANLIKSIGMFEDLRRTHPDFRVDHYKVIDLAALMVKSEKYKEAINILKRELHVGCTHDPALIERNCWELLSSCENSGQTLELFQLLIEKGSCKPTNVVLGAVLRPFLNKKDYDGALRFYVQCSKEYKCTPLQLEMMCATIDTDDKGKLRQIVEATADVHGIQNAQMALIAALAQKGLYIEINRLILDIKSVPRHLLRLRCKKWVEEGKLDVLITLDKAASRLPWNALDANLIYKSIGQIYVNNNDCYGAIEYCRGLLERELRIPKELLEELNRLFNRNKFNVPTDLVQFMKA